MAAPIAARPRLWPLYAYNLEIARAPWVTQQPLIAEMRLQWWRDVVTEGAAPRAHEVAGPLADLIESACLPRDVLDGMAAARRWDIGQEAFDDQAAMDTYLEGTGAALMALAARALGGDVDRAARDAGWAMALAQFLRASADLATRGRVPLVDDSPAGLRDLAQRGLARLDRVRGVPRSIAPAFWPGWQTRALLGQVIADPSVVAGGRIALPPYRRVAGLAWRALTGRP